MKRYSTYIFDLDGTITDTTAVWLDVFQDALLHFSVTPPERAILAKHTHDFRQMLLLGLPEKNFDEFVQFAHKLAKERLPEAGLHDGAEEMLQKLQSQGKKIAIFSTMDRPIFEPAMRYRDLYRFAKVSVAGTDVPRRKPHPDGVLKALEDLEIAKDAYANAVYIGDKDTDIQAAHSAGVNSILYYPQSHQEIYDLKDLQKHNPTHTITHWEELVV